MFILSTRLLGICYVITFLDNFVGCPSGGCASLSFDQRVPKKLLTTASSSRSERHLTVFYIDQIVPGFVVYYLNSEDHYYESGHIADYWGNS